MSKLESESLFYKDSEEFYKNLSDFLPSRRKESDMFYWTQSFSSAKDLQQMQGHHMYRRVMHSPNSNHVTVEDQITGQHKTMIMMGSNSYLGLNNHPLVKNAAIQAIQDYGVGAGSPPHFSGYYDVHRALEMKVAGLKNCEDAIIFPSGYSTNIGVLSCFLTEKDTVIIDRLAHASIVDGARLSGAKICTFMHNDLESLEQALKKHTSSKDGDCLVVIEGVYSMDGDIAPLDKIVWLCEQHGAKLMVDEAHATGVLGDTGCGSAEHFNMHGKIDLVMGTFSKALGGLGGFVAAKKPVVDYLRYYSRSYFFAASVTPQQAAGHSAAIDVLLSEPEWHSKLWRNIHYFSNLLREYGFNIEKTQTAIIPITIGDTIKMREVTKFMHENNIFVNQAPYPAVPKNKDRLRLSVTALHTIEDLDEVFSILVKADLKHHFSNK